MGRRKRNVSWTLYPGRYGWWVRGVGFVYEDPQVANYQMHQHGCQSWKDYRTADKAVAAFANLLVRGFQPLLTKEYWHHGVRYAQDYGYLHGYSEEPCAKLVEWAKQYLEGQR